MAAVNESSENSHSITGTDMKRVKSRARKILVLDVGGTHVKLRLGQGEMLRFDSGPKMGPREMVRQVRKLAANWRYDALSIGYPGLIVRGRITAEPHNLGKGWVRFDFAKAFGKPVRVINDAAMQAMGSYEGGRMLFLGLGTGLGATLIMNGIVEPLEIGHLPYKHGRSYEDYVGERGLQRLGAKKWRRVVNDVVEQLRTVLEVEYVVLGGGNTHKLRKLPKKTHRGDNLNAFIGGARLWEQTEENVLTVSTRQKAGQRRAVRR